MIFDKINNDFKVYFWFEERISETEDSGIETKEGFFSPTNEELLNIFVKCLEERTEIEEDTIKDLTILGYFDIKKMLEDLLNNESISCKSFKIALFELGEAFQDWYMDSEIFKELENKYDFYNIEDGSVKVKRA